MTTPNIPPCPFDYNEQDKLRNYLDARDQRDRLKKQLKARSIGWRIIASFSLRVQLGRTEARLAALREQQPTLLTPDQIAHYEAWKDDLAAALTSNDPAA